MFVDHQVISSEPPHAAPALSASVNCPVVHLVMREGLSSIFEAMVVTPLSSLHERGIDTRLVVFSPIGEFLRWDLRKRWQQRIEASRRVYYRPIHRLGSPPARARSLWSEAWVLKKWMTRYIGADRPAILHCRGPEAADVALQVRARMPKLKVIFDMRGLVDAEYLYDRGLEQSDGEHRRLARVQRRAARRADAMFCVSHAMAEYAVEHLGARENKITVLPCAVRLNDAQRRKSDRRSTRRRFGLENRFVVAFSGGPQPWQKPMRAARAFQVIKRLRPSAHFLVLTFDADQMRGILTWAGISQDDVTILSVPHAQITEYLVAADMGLLLRDRSIVNAVASPVKFAEFLACGVPVAISEGLGDYSALVEQRRIGVVLSADESEMGKSLWRFLESFDRDRLCDLCREVAHDELDIEKNTDRTIHVYGQLCLDSCESCT